METEDLTEYQEGEALIYVDKEPDVGALSEAYDTCLIDLNYYFDACLRSYDDRRNIWDGKSDDLRKNGANAFPWQGASDQEVNVIGERIDTYVALFDQALQRSHIKAFPTSMASMPRTDLKNPAIGIEPPMPTRTARLPMGMTSPPSRFAAPWSTIGSPYHTCAAPAKSG